MANCQQCNRRMPLLERLSAVCTDCTTENHQRAVAIDELNLSHQAAIDLTKAEAEEQISKAASAIILTTESSLGLHVAERLEIITAECVLGMNIFKDIGSSLRDLVGGRNEAYQKVLKDARKTVLQELRHEALQIGADAVVAVDLDYSEISGGGKSMLFLVASGTAVRLGTATRSAS